MKLFVIFAIISVGAFAFDAPPVMKYPSEEAEPDIAQCKWFENLVKWRCGVCNENSWTSICSAHK